MGLISKNVKLQAWGEWGKQDGNCIHTVFFSFLSFYNGGLRNKQHYNVNNWKQGD